MRCTLLGRKHRVDLRLINYFFADSHERNDSVERYYRVNHKNNYRYAPHRSRQVDLNISENIYIIECSL